MATIQEDVTRLESDYDVAYERMTMLRRLRAVAHWLTALSVIASVVTIAARGPEGAFVFLPAAGFWTARAMLLEPFIRAHRRVIRIADEILVARRRLDIEGMRNRKVVRRMFASNGALIDLSSRSGGGAA